MPILQRSNIPYPDFQNLQIIDPDKFDINNAELQNKVNALVDFANDIQDPAELGIQTSMIVDGAVTDVKIGDRSIDDSVVPISDVGTISILFNNLANMIKGITGKANWRTAPIKSIEVLNTELTSEINTRSSADTTLQNNINLKANIASPTFTGTVSGVTKSMVGLSNVDNTSDLNKPVSTATSNALTLKVDTTTLAAHKTSSDHDGRYFTKSEISSTTDGSSGSDKVGTTPIVGLAGSTVQSVFESLKSFIDTNFISKTNTTSFIPTLDYHPATKSYVDITTADAVLGAVPDSSITNNKLANDIKVGSLATLNTTSKVSVVSAINEVNSKTIADGSITNDKLATDVKIGSLAMLSTAIKTSVVSAINDVVSMFTTIVRSTSQTTQTPVTSYPTATEDGLVNYTIGGQSLVNAVTNGNFVNTNGWTAAASTISATSNTLTITGSGSDANPRASQQVPITLTTGKKVYIRAVSRVTNAVCASMDFYVNGASGGTLVNIGIVNTPVQNQFYRMSGILNVTDQSGLFFPRIRHNYADAATANTKVMEVRDVICVDLDAHGLTTKTLAELDAMSDAYFDSLTSVVNPVVVSEGKNLFKPENVITGYYFNQASNSIIAGGASDKVVYARCAPNTTYTVSKIAGQRFIVGYTTALPTANSRVEAISANTVASSHTLTTGNNATYIVAWVYSTSFDTGLTAQQMLNSVQIESGSTPTTYEPYTSNTLSIPATLRSLPNGVRDTVAQSGNGVVTLTQNVSAEYTLLSGDITTLTTTGVNFDYVTVNKTSFANSATWADAVEGKVLVPNWFETANGSGDLASRCWSFATGFLYIYFLVPKGTYANLAAAQTALAGTKILYQLATPVVTTLQTDDWISYKSGRFTTSTAIVPQAVINTPINLAGKIKDIFTIVENIDDKIGPLGTLTTITKTSVVSAINEVNSKTLIDGSVTNTKLATDVKVGSLASLITTIKTSVVDSINELALSVAGQGDVTYYIDPVSGSDLNTGLTSGSPLKTFSVVTGKLKKYVVGDVYIYFIAGTSSESIYLSGFYGPGRIFVSRLTTTPTINSITVRQCNLYVKIDYFTLTSATVIATAITESPNVYLTNIAATSSGVGVCFRSESSNVRLTSCTFSNHGTGLSVVGRSRVYAAYITGTGNTIGIVVDEGSILHKGLGNTITGTTAQTIADASLVINNSGGTIGT